MTTNTTLTPQALAARLHGRTMRNEISKDEAAEAKAAGLVVVFGASDDLMEFRGAIYDELGAYNGTTAHLTSDGLLQNECSAEDCPAHAKAIDSAQKIAAIWCPDETTSWAYKTDIPHATFDVVEDGDVYCRGIVFALVDVGAQAPTKEQQSQRWTWFHDGDERVPVLHSEAEAHGEAAQSIDNNCEPGERHEYLVAPMVTGIDLLPAALHIGQSIVENINEGLSDEMGAEEDPLDLTQEDLAALGEIVREFIRAKADSQWWTVDTTRQAKHNYVAGSGAEAAAA